MIALKINISKTEPNTLKYPLHTHNHWEIMYYVSGSGYLATDEENIDFTAGSIIAVPPNTPHGSVSEYGFCNISIGADFSHLLHFDKPILISDNSHFEGKTLANLIYNNRFCSQNLLSSLCEAFAYFFTENTNTESHAKSTVYKIAKQIQQNYNSPDIDIAKFLDQSGYSRDYIRNCFTKEIGLSPVAFLAKERIEKARKLIEIYGRNIPLGRICEMCGYVDYIYFSKTFTKLVGISPKAYLDNLFQSVSYSVD